MLISYNWINKYFDNRLPKPNELVEILNSHAFEVESVEDLSQRFNKIVVGQVVGVEKHPDADRLSVARVNTGSEELQIVCGASNLEKNQKVPVATVGAILPDGFEIGKAKLRGVESNGMICSESELGLAKESEGIMVLDESAKIGQNFAEYLNLNDTILDIDVLPNRAHDCLSHRGMAKEIAILTDLEPEIKKSGVPGTPQTDIKSSIVVKIEDEKLCRRYIAVEVQNIEVKESPEWLKKSLESIGQRSINNIVDATNYVMFDLGQPLHAFDREKLSGGKIIVRNAKSGEKITTLDKQEVELDESVLIIADEQSPLAIAGVKGGDKAEVDKNTKNIVLESANFDPTSIRKTSRRLNIPTDSAKRFENEISTELAGVAMDELVALIKEVAGTNDTQFGVKNDVYPRKPNLYKVGVSTDEVNKLLGTNISDKQVEEILDRFGFEYEKINPLEKVLELAPTFVGVPYKLGASVTYDAPNKFDCSSFASYLFAQAGVSIPRISIDQYLLGDRVSKSGLRAGDLIFANTGEGKIHYESVEFLSGTKIEEGVDHLGVYLGDGQVIHSSRYNKNGVGIGKIEDFDQFKNVVGYRRVVEKGAKRYMVTIPYERMDLRIKEDLIEEIGRVYGYKNIESILPESIGEPKINKVFYYSNKVRKILGEIGFSEVQTYTFGDRGEVEVQKPLASNLGCLRTNLTDGIQKSLDLNLKNALLLGLDEIKIFEIGKVFPSIDSEYTSFAIGIRSAKKMKASVIAKAKRVAIQEVISILNSELNIDLKAEEKDGIFEINFDELVEKLPELENYDGVLPKEIGEAIKYQKISPYPFMLRDIAVWLPNDKNSDDLLAIITENAGDLLVNTKLFDTYAPEGENRTSYAFNLVFQSGEKTLTDDEVNKIMDKITKEVEKNGWEVR